MEREETSDYCSFNESGTIPEIIVYPPYTFRRKPSWLSNLIFPFNAKTGSVNKEIINLIDEVYIALQNGCNRLSVMGVRALIEHVMIQKVGDQRSFMKNMNAFQDQGFISKVQRQALDHVLNAGHAAIHRSYNPKINEVIAAIDIVENILESIYTVDKRQNCFKNVPSRKTT
ncbi:DUF4145 domain-containing protein [Aliivibrio fischeri]|uniref:DUF4145 domain-containing protein n=1 Tax=Aliivibrio fischeri TaxID=668 RepID=UPI001BDF631A|nr:DUF4145 domain-containing protein [Aliivibrio fischeri]